MIFYEKYKDIIKTKKDLEKQLGKIGIENNIMHDFDISVTGHFGNSVSFTLMCDNICPPAMYNNKGNIGYIIAFLVDFFDKEDDNTISVKKSLKEIPIRLVFDDDNGWGGKCIGLGHFMKDRFILFENLCKISK